MGAIYSSPFSFFFLYKRRSRRGGGEGGGPFAKMGKGIKFLFLLLLLRCTETEAGKESERKGGKKWRRKKMSRGEIERQKCKEKRQVFHSAEGGREGG